MANNYQILVDVLLNNSQVQSQLNGLKSVNDVGEDIGLTFQQANMILNKCLDTITDMVDQVYKLNDATTEFAKVSSLTGDALDSYVSDLAKIGKTVARTGQPFGPASTDGKCA